MSKEKTALQRVREQLKNLGNSEFAAVAENEALQSLFNERQALIAEMHVAKKEAAAKAAEPYQQALNKLEANYAMYLKLSSR